MNDLSNVIEIGMQASLERAEANAAAGIRTKLYEESGWLTKSRTAQHDLLQEILNGTAKQIRPDMVSFEDSHLLYAGKIHSIAGESGSGKSIFAMHSAIDVLRGGGVVFYFDIETQMLDNLQRMLEFGAQPDELNRYYLEHPTQAAGAEIGYICSAIEQVVLTGAQVLVVIDSAGEAISLQGGKQDSDEDVANWMRAVPRPLAEAGAAVLLIDHVVKANGNGGGFAIGSQRKRAAIDVQFILESVERFERGRAGHANISVSKDRYGYLSQRGCLAELHVEPDNGVSHTSLERGKQTASNDYAEVVMEKVSQFIESSVEPPSTKKIKDGIGGDNKLVEKALKRLIGGGYVSTEPGARNARLHTSVKPFRFRDVGAEIDEDELFEEIDA